MNVPIKVQSRIKSAIPKYKRIIKGALARDVNEAETVKIVEGLLQDVYGYDIFTEVSSQYKVRNQYIDLAIEIEHSVRFIIEVKRIGLDLNENHLKQAVHYAADKGIDWVVLTNGSTWEAYKVLFGKPIKTEMVVSLDFQSLNLRDHIIYDQLFTLCREGLSKSAISEFHKQQRAVHRHRIGEALFSDGVLRVIRKELKKKSKISRIDISEVEEVLATEVLKREIIEGAHLKKNLKDLLDK